MRTGLVDARGSRWNASWETNKEWSLLNQPVWGFEILNESQHLHCQDFYFKIFFSVFCVCLDSCIPDSAQWSPLMPEILDGTQEVKNKNPFCLHVAVCCQKWLFYISLWLLVKKKSERKNEAFTLFLSPIITHHLHWSITQHHICWHAVKYKLESQNILAILGGFSNFSCFHIQFLSTYFGFVQFTQNWRANISEKPLRLKVFNCSGLLTQDGAG